MLKNTRKRVLFLPFLLFLFLFSFCKTESTSSEKAPVKVDLEILLGRWQSINDPKNVIELTTRRMYSFYDGLKLADESLVIYHNCVASCVPEGRTAMPCLVTDGKKAVNCFEVIELTKNSLVYCLVGNKDNLLKFKKM